MEECASNRFLRCYYTLFFALPIYKHAVTVQCVYLKSKDMNPQPLNYIPIRRKMETEIHIRRWDMRGHLARKFSRDVANYKLLSEGP
ncbi:hypothetical protein M513_05503 [Trichuris suis]|uniref:Uncharacterized protein n=1 Tax=Trichuris suis TaxID=68888 RepID=A0A085M8P1_9BILA|nr:hypothetical protein M513_05503 [Trichuris suis]